MQYISCLADRKLAIAWIINATSKCESAGRCSLHSIWPSLASQPSYMSLMMRHRSAIWIYDIDIEFMVSIKLYDVIFLLFVSCAVFASRSVITCVCGVAICGYRFHCGDSVISGTQKKNIKVMDWWWICLPDWAMWRWHRRHRHSYHTTAIARSSCDWGPVA